MAGGESQGPEWREGWPLNRPDLGPHGGPTVVGLPRSTLVAALI